MKDIMSMNKEELIAYTKTLNWFGVTIEEVIEDIEEVIEDIKIARLWLHRHYDTHAITNTVEFNNVVIYQIGDTLRQNTYFEPNTIRYHICEKDSKSNLTGRCDPKLDTIDVATAIAKQYDELLEHKCEMATVEFSSGKLTIGNFFNGYDDIDPKIKFTEKYNICNSPGIANTMKWLADNKNIAYCQLGNLSVTAYKVNDDRIVFVQPYYYGEDVEVEEFECLKDWKEIGSVSCEMWRVEVIDRQDAKRHNFDLGAYKKERSHMDIHNVTVNKGTWEIKSYYLLNSDKELYEKFGCVILAELNRVI